MADDAVLAYVDEDLENALTRLCAFLKIPSISTDPAYREDCQTAAEWLRCDLQSMGFSASLCETAGHPIVLGEAGPEGGMHLLFYGHYDVQPVDPLELWTSPPFEPCIEETAQGRVIRGRGASDDKGQLMTFLEACRAWITVHGALPCRITIFLEGEEESGSPSLVPFLHENANRLKADLALICDTGLFEDRTPAIITQLRGMLSEEVVIHGADQDLHSGMFGGIAANPARVLSQLIAGLYDSQGRVTLPNFYDGVPELPKKLAKRWQELAFSEADFLGKVGLSHPAGEAGRSGLEMLWTRPTCEINGITAGYQGAGFKTVLPAKASAKISFRLVGTQDPQAIRAAFQRYITDALPSDCRAEFISHGASQAVQMATEHPIFSHTSKALEAEWQCPVAFVGCGGSIPIAGHFKEILGMDSMLTGFARDCDQIHSPNESYALAHFQKGIRSWARLLAKI